MDKAKLQQDLIAAMKSGDDVKKSTIRMLMSSISYYQIEKGGAGYEAAPEEILIVIEKEAKKRRDAISEYEKAGRQELVDKETEELKILEEYLPEKMSEEEVTKIIEETISETGASSMADMGKIMGALNSKVKGQADMGMVSSIVKQKLSS